LQAHFALDAVEERSRIGCRAARFGRNDPCLDALMLGELAAAELERLDRALHRRFGKPAGLAQPLPQSNDARKAIKHAKAVLSRLGDQETAIVGAQVERGVNGSALLARPAGFGLRCPPRPALGARMRLCVV